MNHYAFSVVIGAVAEPAVDALYGRCGDCSVGTRSGQHYAAFDRDAERLEQAIGAAIDDLHQVGIEPLRVELAVPDLMAR
jgi:hypothetical protein